MLCRHYDYQLRQNRDSIRQHISQLEQSRRRFSQTARQRHGPLDPPKPGEEYVLRSLKDDAD